MIRYALGWLAGVALALGAAGGGGALAQGAGATAVLRDGSGTVLGTVTLSQTAEGIVASGQLQGLQPGLHGVHIHEVGRCEAPFTSAGEHWNPSGRQHGVRNPAGPHLSDLYNTLEPAAGSNVRAGADGNAPMRGLFRGATIAPGTLSVADADGSALLVHTAEDDNLSDPSGNSGGRVACGVIVAGVGGLPRTGGAPWPGALAGAGAGLLGLFALRRLRQRS